MGKKIFFTGLIVSLIGGFALLISPFLLSFLETQEIEIKQESPALNTSKIPQKISNTAEKIQADFYVNFTCPHCRDFYKNSLASLKKDYESEISFEIKNYPFINTGLEMEMAEFFICAKEQKEAFFVLDFFFFGKDEITEMKSEEWITDLALDPEKMALCLETSEAKVLSEKNKGKERGVRGAPTLFIEKGEISEKFEGNIEKYQIEMRILPLISQ